MDNHIAATFHPVHYDRLTGQADPKADAIVARPARPEAGRELADQPAGARPARHLRRGLRPEPAGRRPARVPAGDREGCRLGLDLPQRGRRLRPLPRQPSDADAVYFQVGTLVMAGVLRTIEPPPADPHLLGWGTSSRHLSGRRRGSHGSLPPMPLTGRDRSESLTRVVTRPDAGCGMFRIFGEWCPGLRRGHQAQLPPGGRARARRPGRCPTC